MKGAPYFWIATYSYFWLQSFNAVEFDDKYLFLFYNVH